MVLHVWVIRELNIFEIVLIEASHLGSGGHLHLLALDDSRQKRQQASNWTPNAPAKRQEDSKYRQFICRWGSRKYRHGPVDIFCQTHAPKGTPMSTKRAPHGTKWAHTYMHECIHTYYKYV